LRGRRARCVDDLLERRVASLIAAALFAGEQTAVKRTRIRCYRVLDEQYSTVEYCSNRYKMKWSHLGCCFNTSFEIDPHGWRRKLTKLLQGLGYESKLGPGLPLRGFSCSDFYFIPGSRRAPDFPKISPCHLPRRSTAHPF
jgi:hypothetical protein